MRKKTGCRILAVLLCISMLFASYCEMFDLHYILASAAEDTVLQQDKADDGNNKQDVTQEQIKASLMRKISSEGWDPYSSNMTLDEFYALMELFKEGKLPLKSKAATIALANQAEASQDIPRTLFMFSGLSNAGLTDADAPLEYDNENGGPEETDQYPPHLDDGGIGYQRPPKNWTGVKTEDLQATIVKKRENDDDPTIAGNVVQGLFQKYDGYYVRRVTVQNSEVSVLGAINLDGKYVYYYLTSDNQSTDVSATTLPEGQKFIVQYVPLEHLMTYKVEMADGSEWPIKGVVPPTNPETGEGASEAYYTLLDSIFGADRTTSTVDRYYSFRATVPDGYELQIFRQIEGKGREEVTGKSSATGITHNDGYPLGREPQYSIVSNFNLLVDTSSGPSTLMTSDTFYNDKVGDNRTIIAVLTKKAKPTFDAWSWISNTSGTPNRGTSAASDYDYEKDDSSKNKSYPNIVSTDVWDWTTGGKNDAVYHTMTEDTDGTGTYSWRWTFQTNFKGSDDFLLDSLAVNGVELSIPFLPRWHAWGNGKTQNDIKPNQPAVGEVEGKSYTVMKFPDGMTVRLDYLCLFAWNASNQRVYRLTITGARSNVTVTGGNLMQYGSGAPEFVVSSLTGIHAGDPKVEAIQVYDNGDWVTSNESDIIVTQNDTFYQSNDIHGANIRFKLADGYASPYYYFTTLNDIVISDQATVEQYDNGEVFTDESGSVTLKEGSLVSDLNVQDSQHIYGPDSHGWYYLKLNTRGDNRASLLSIGARPVKYVVRYLPTYPADAVKPTEFDANKTGIVTNPTNLPTFEHYVNQCHPSFWWETDNGIPGKQYDDKNGYYYDTVEDLVARVPTTSDMIPMDPQNKYEFVDWVLVDKYSYPVLVDANNNQVISDKYGSLVLIDENGYPVLVNESGEKVSGAGMYVVLDENGVATLLNVDGTPADTDAKLVLISRTGKFVDISGQEVTVDENVDTSSWKALNTQGDAVELQSLKDFHYLGNPITIAEVNEYAILNDGLGGTDIDVMVLRLMPTWRQVENPYNYQVRLLWVDAEGVLQRFDYKGDWRDILTDWDDSNEKLTVKVITGSTPFLNWIAQHPTYTFWDAVNNAVDDPDLSVEGAKTAKQKIEDAIAKDIPALTAMHDQKNYEYVLSQLLKGSNGENDEFTRLGNYAFSVNENGGTITICMYENKGGLVFHKDVRDEPFVGDDEFYFTVENLRVGNKEKGKLEGTYKAYPEVVYDDNGKIRETLDSDAWLVTFEEGKITAIVKNDDSAPPKKPVTYFTLKHNEGILLYVPDGQYTITETGSKSGGSYKVKLSYVDLNGESIPADSWIIPSENDLWLKGKANEYYDPEDVNYPKDVSQVSVTVDFDIGENNVVQTLTFSNQTSSLAIEKVVNGTRDRSTEFTFDVKLKLPESVKPLQDEATGEYYFNYNLYDVDYSKNQYGDLTFNKNGRIKLTEITNASASDLNWQCEKVKLKAGQRMVIVMTVPDQSDIINYSVKEIEIPDGYQLAPGQAETRSGSIGVGQMRVEKITNVTGNLTVVNQIDGADAKDKGIVFTVTLSDKNINGKLGDMDFVNGVAKFTLRTGEFKTATLPTNVGYTIAEADALDYVFKDITGEVKWITSGTENTDPPTNDIDIDKSAKTAAGTITDNVQHIITFVYECKLELPSTGGIGTVMFYVFGGSMILAALCLMALLSMERKSKMAKR